MSLKRVDTEFCEKMQRASHWHGTFEVGKLWSTAGTVKMSFHWTPARFFSGPVPLHLPGVDRKSRRLQEPKRRRPHFLVIFEVHGFASPAPLTETKLFPACPNLIAATALNPVWLWDRSGVCFSTWLLVLQNASTSVGPCLRGCCLTCSI